MEWTGYGIRDMGYGTRDVLGSEWVVMCKVGRYLYHGLWTRRNVSWILYCLYVRVVLWDCVCDSSFERRCCGC